MTKRQNIFKFFLALIVVSMLGLGIFLTIDPTRKAIHSIETIADEEPPKATEILQDVDDFSYQDEDNTICIGLSEKGYNKLSGDAYFDVVFPAGVRSIIGKSTSWGSSVFTYNDKHMGNKIISISFKDSSLETIGKYAFYRCLNLQSITIPNSVTKIDSLAFANCSALTSITIPDNVTEIGNAFSGCSQLQTVEISEKSALKGEIPLNTFANCSALKSINIPDGITCIGMDAFSRCSSLQKVEISQKSNLKTIEPNAFSYCSALSIITIPDTVTSIESSAFSYCSALSIITIPDSVISTGYFVFDGCSKLHIVVSNETRANQLKTDQAFRGAFSGKKITYPVAIKFKKSESNIRTEYKLFGEEANWCKENNIWIWDDGYKFKDFDTGVWVDKEDNLINAPQLTEILQAAVNDEQIKNEITNGYTLYYRNYKINISTVEVTIPDDTIYDGKEHKPILQYGNYLLHYGIDYETVGETDFKNYGTKTFTIHGIDYFEGTLPTTYTFTIEPKDINDQTISISLSNTTEQYYIFDGKSKDCLIAQDSGLDSTSTTLARNIDYKVTWHVGSEVATDVVEEPIDAGTYYGIVEGIGNYKSIYSKTFEITIIMPPITNLYLQNQTNSDRTQLNIDTPEIILGSCTPTFSCSNTTSFEEIKNSFITHIKENVYNSSSGGENVTFKYDADWEIIGWYSYNSAKIASDLLNSKLNISIWPQVWQRYVTGLEFWGPDNDNLVATKNKLIAFNFFIIQGKGNYSGTAVIYFEVTPDVEGELEVTVLNQKNDGTNPLEVEWGINIKPEDVIVNDTVNNTLLKNSSEYYVGVSGAGDVDLSSVFLTTILAPSIPITPNIGEAKLVIVLYNYSNIIEINLKITPRSLSSLEIVAAFAPNGDPGEEISASNLVVYDAVFANWALQFGVDEVNNMAKSLELTLDENNNLDLLASGLVEVQEESGFIISPTEKGKSLYYGFTTLREQQLTSMIVMTGNTDNESLDYWLVVNDSIYRLYGLLEGNPSLGGKCDKITLWYDGNPFQPLWFAEAVEEGLTGNVLLLMPFNIPWVAQSEMESYIIEAFTETPDEILNIIGSCCINPSLLQMKTNGDFTNMATHTVTITSDFYSGELQLSLEIALRPLTNMIILAEDVDTEAVTGCWLILNGSMYKLNISPDGKSTSLGDNCDKITLQYVGKQFQPIWFTNKADATGNILCMLPFDVPWVDPSLIGLVYKSALEEASDQNVVGEIIAEIASLYIDPSILKMDISGDFTNVDSNGHTVRITSKFYTDLLLTLEITPKDISMGDVTVSPDQISDQIFTGNEFTPSFTITDTTIGDELTLNEDYTIEYFSDSTRSSQVEPIEHGTYYVSIKGKGNYSGQINLEKPFEITPKPLSEGDVEISNNFATYDGTEKDLESILNITTNEGMTPLAYGTDWTFEVTGATLKTGTFNGVVLNAGEYSVTINFTGNYSGSITTTFTVKQKNIEDTSITVADTTYNPATKDTGTTTTITIVDGSYTLIFDSDYEVKYSNNINAGTGSVTITAKENSNYTGTVSREFTITAKALSQGDVGVDITIDDIQPQEYTGTEICPTPKIYWKGQEISSDNYDLSYSSNVEHGESTAKVIFKFKKNFSGSIEKTFTITPKSLSEGDVEISNNSATYDGKEKDLESILNITTNEGMTPLAYDTDWTLEVTGATLNTGTFDGSVLNSGKYTVKINFTGNYSGDITTTFTINKVSFEDADKIQISISGSYTYTGKEIKPTVVVTWTGHTDYEMTLEDFTVTNVEGVDNISAGQGKVKVSGKGNFDGSKEITFEIQKKDIGSEDVTVQVENTTYSKGNDQKQEFTLSYNGEIVSPTEYSYTYERRDGKGDDFESAGTVTVVVTANGINFSNTKEFTYQINKLKISKVELNQNIVDYNFEKQMPTITVKDVNEAEVDENEYSISYLDPDSNLKSNFDFTNVGKVKICIKANADGNYLIDEIDGDNSLYATFEIQAVDISKVEKPTIEAKTYTGSQISPEITLKYNNHELTVKTDYSIEYGENTNVQTGGQVHVTGNGNFTGRATYDFDITPASMSDVTVTNPADVEYNGKAQNPAPTLKLGEYTLQDDEFDLVYDGDFTNHGTKTIKVNGKKNFTGSTTATFTITQRELSKSNVTIDGFEDTLEYNGSPLTQNNLKITDKIIMVEGENKELILGADYTVEYYSDEEFADKVEQPTNQGTYYVLIKGNENYTGDIRTKSFTINAAELKQVNLIENVTYDGETHNDLITSILAGKTTFYKEDLSGLNLQIEYSRDGKNSEIDYVNAGSITVTVTPGDNTNFTGSATKTFTINPKEFSESTVTIDGFEDTLEYNGSPLTQDNFKITDQTIMVEGENKELILDTDYTIEYSENRTNVKDGPVTVTIKGLGNYAHAEFNQIQKTFTITPKPIQKGEVQLDQTSYDYDGENHLPTVSVNTDGGLTQDRDFTVEYYKKSDKQDKITEAKEVGTYYVVVSGKDNYVVANGEKDYFEITFSIGTTDLSGANVELDWESNTYSGEHIPQIVTVTIGEKPLSPDTDYKLEIKKGDTLETAETTEEFEGVGTYWVVLTGLEPNYSGTNNSHSFTITQTSLESAEVKLSEEDTTWSNKEIKKTITSVTLTVTLNSKSQTLSSKTITITSDKYSFEYYRDDNYETNCTDFISVGKITLRLTATDPNFTGSIDASYSITPKSFDNVKISELVDKPYNRQSQTQDITISDDELVYTLVDKKDYNVAYLNNKDAGEVTVTITPIGNYTGDPKVLHFNITAVEITDVILKENGTVEFEENVSHDIIERVVAGDLGALTKDEYMVTYKRGDSATTDFTKHGTITVIVQSNNKNFTGDPIEKEFHITQKSINSLITFDWTDKEWTAEEQAPTINTQLKLADDYTVEYFKVQGQERTPCEKPSDAGQYVLVVTGQENYQGKLEKSFNILQRSINENMLETFQETYAYTRQKINLVYSLKYNSTPLQENTDFRIEFVDRTDAPTEHGQYTIKFIGMKNLKDEFTKQFTIDTLKITEDAITKPQTLEFSGNDLFDTLLEQISIEINSLPLTYDTDYTVTRVSDDMINILSSDHGVKSYTITGKGNFSDSVTLTFTITQKSLDKETMLNVTPETYYFNYGEQVKPSYTLSFNGNTLSKGNDYQEDFENNTIAGNAKMILTGKGNYTGEIEFEYMINKIDPTVNIVVNENGDLFYAGEDAKNHEISTSAGDTEGEVAFDNYLLTEEDSLKDEVKLNWTFTPTDNINFNDYHGQYTITNGVCIKVEVNFNEQQFEDVSDSQDIDFDIEVKKLIGAQSVVLDKDMYLQTLVNAQGVVAENISTGGYYTITISFEDKRFVIVGKSSLQFYVKSTTITSNSGISAYCEEGFEEGVTIRVDKITDQIRISEMLGESYGKLGKILYINCVKFIKEGQEVEVSNVQIRQDETIELSNVYIKQEKLKDAKIYMYGNNTLTDITQQVNNDETIKFSSEQNIFIYESVESNNAKSIWIWISIGIAGGLVLLAVAVIVLHYVIKKRKSTY